MRFEFTNSKIRKLFTDESGAKKYPSEVIDAFFEVMTVIDSAQSEQDIRALKHLHFEKLKGDRKHERSLKLHGGFRLVVELDSDDQGTYFLVKEIEDYHR